MGAATQIIITLVLAAAGAEHGEGHGEHGGLNLFEYLSTVTNFVVMFGFLGYVVKTPLANFLESRRENMAARLREAREKQVAAEKRITDYKHRLDHLEEEVERIVQSYEKEADADRERMRMETERAIERMTREANFTITQEVRKAEKTIREAAAAATLEAAEMLIKERITDSDQRRLADTYIAGLEHTARR